MLKWVGGSDGFMGVHGDPAWSCSCKLIKANGVHLFLPSRQVISCWWLDTGYGGNIYTT